MSPLASFRTELELRLTPEARAWLRRALEDAASHAESPDGPAVAPQPGGRSQLPAWERHFAEAARRCGAPSPADPLAEHARILLLHAAEPSAATVTRLYHHGSAPERRAVLLALPHLPLSSGPEAVPLLEDALRSNDTRLIAAALGPYATAHLDPHSWRHAVLKCLFTGVPLSLVDGLELRAPGDAELARMLADYARERTAAGRPVPPDLHHAARLADPEAFREPATPEEPAAPEEPAEPEQPAASRRPGTALRPRRTAPPQESATPQEPAAPQESAAQED